MHLKDRVVLVTGASRGIGAATAKLFAQHGAKVAINYAKNRAAAEQVLSDIVKNNGRGFIVGADVRQVAEVEAMVKRVVSELGPIDILVLNAGAEVPYKLFASLSFEEFEGKVMGEMKGFFFPLKAVIPSMIERKKGCIIGVSSGLSRYPSPNFSAHTTAKSAVDGLMKSLAMELGPFGIRVNTVAPGLTLTDATAWLPKDRVNMMAAMAPLRRVAMPEDIANVIMMMASDDAGFVTGAYIPVSGGQQML